MRVFLTRYLKNDSGATAIEYGLIAAGIAAVIVITVNSLGDKVNNVFENITAFMR